MKDVRQEKGITLIALVITIIVLLILAGIYIAMLTAETSAPVKATEAAQKDAISALKDDVAVHASEKLLNYYDTTYVKATGTNIGNSAAEDSARDAVRDGLQKLLTGHTGSGKQILTAELNGANGDKATDHTITVTTKDFSCTGHITKKGAITWDNIATK